MDLQFEPIRTVKRDLYCQASFKLAALRSTATPQQLPAGSTV
jgi:hypothetical protein